MGFVTAAYAVIWFSFIAYFLLVMTRTAKTKKIIVSLEQGGDAAPAASEESGK